MCLNIGIVIVDGGWTVWLDADECSVSCGGGIQNQTRFCASPAPENGGLDCEGPSQQTTICNEWSCPKCEHFCVSSSSLLDLKHIYLAPIWTPWADLSSCTVTCGLGHLTRFIQSFRKEYNCTREVVFISSFEGLGAASTSPLKPLLTLPNVALKRSSMVPVLATTPTVQVRQLPLKVIRKNSIITAINFSSLHGTNDCHSIIIL